MSSRDHILVVPKVVLGLRIVQVVVAVVILGLAAYGVTFLSFDGDGITLFSALASIIIVAYNLVADIAAPVLYNYWAILGLDIFAIIFWLISFPLLASEVAAYQIATYNADTCIYGYCYKKRGLNFFSKRVATTNIYTYRNSLAAAAGLGGLEFLLFIATLVITSIYLLRHRKAGGHCIPGATGSVPEVEEAAQPAGYAQQPVYQQQSVYEQQQVQQPVYQQQQVQQPVYQQQPVQYAATPEQQIASA